MSLNVINLDHNIYAVDVFDQGVPGRTSCYVIVAGTVALIETGPSPGVDHLTDAFKQLGISPEQVKHIIVTHVHLDHAGGAGIMARKLPEAKVYVHPKGARHLIDPSRLVAGAKAVYGEHFDGFFGEVLPVTEKRIRTPEDGAKLDLGDGRSLNFIYAPGHARHHLVLHDPSSRGVFSGDALGVRFSALSEFLGHDFILPSTPPTDFKPDLYVETLKRISKLGIENIFFTHFGKAVGAGAVISRNIEMAGVFEAVGRRVLASGGRPEDIKEELWKIVMIELEKYNITDREHPALEFLAFEIELNAAGIAYFLKKQ